MSRKATREQIRLEKQISRLKKLCFITLFLGIVFGGFGREIIEIYKEILSDDNSSLVMLNDEPKLTSLYDNLTIDDGSATSEKAIQKARNKELSKFISDRASDLGIDPKIIVSLISTESKGNKYAIGIVAQNANFIYDRLNNDNNRAKMKLINGGGKYISIVPQDEVVAEQLYDYLNANMDELGITTMDYGIMQINHHTLLSYELDPKQIYLNEFYNIAVGIDILKSCSNLFANNQEYTIECYNKGTDSSKFASLDYYNKFLMNYRKMFNN